MRVVLVGQGSFIARHIWNVARSQEVSCVAFAHDTVLNGAVNSDDTVINFTLDPRYRDSPYTEDIDRDLCVARSVAKVGANFIMLSSRRVYSADSCWNAVETIGAEGDTTAYGRNKARSELAVSSTLPGRVGIFRLSNIFGPEYDAAQRRNTFLAKLLTSLKHKKKIFFDMHPDTRRDFLPVELCARLILQRALDRTTGVFNLGSGFAIQCGDLAHWIMEGFGTGELVCDPMIVRDEFFLNMGKWRENFDLSVTKQTLRDYCVQLGRSLQCERS